MLEVYDDLFTHDFLVLLNMICKSNIGYSYTNSANRYQYPLQSTLSKGSHTFFGKILYEKSNDYRVFNETPNELFDVLEHFVFNIIQKDLDLVQIQVNFQVHGQNGNSHLDKYREDGKDRTIMFYPHYKWDDSWGGDLEITDENENVIDSYLPLPGRIIYFDSKMLHRGLGPSAMSEEPRISIAFRMALK